MEAPAERVSVQVNAQDLVRCILQYFRENNLTRTLECLQEESGISLNTVDSVDGLVGDILQGKWDLALTQLHSLSLPRDIIVPLYEQVVFELLGSGERDLAREFIRTTPALSSMQRENTQRYLRLEHLCQRPAFDSSLVYEHGSSKESRRQELAEALRPHLMVAEPSRLLVLVGQALKYQQSVGLLPAGASQRFNLFTNANKVPQRDLQEKPIKRLAGSIRFAPESHPETACFSPGADDESLVTGSMDGFIEVWDIESCQLRQDLEYQSRNELMAHDAEAVLSSAFSRDGLLLATGSQSGQIKVWKLSTGECLRKFPQAHPQGVTSIAFSRDGTQLLTTSFDQTVRVLGIKSGKQLKQFDGHTSYVNCACYSRDGTNVFSGSSDGCVKVWDTRTSECVATWRPGAQVPGSFVASDRSIHTLQLMPNTPDHLFVVPRGSCAYVVTPAGDTLRELCDGGAMGTGTGTGTGIGGEGGERKRGRQDAAGRDFLCATISPQGKWAYCLDESGLLTVFDVPKGSVEHSFSAISEPGREIISVVHHPHRNLLISLQDDGHLKVWRP